MFNKNKAFTLVEIIIVAGILSSVLLLVFQTIVSIFESGQAIENSVKASFLAQEGMEIIRAVSDTNWLKNPNDSSKWKDRFFSCGTNICYFRVEYGIEPSSGLYKMYPSSSGWKNSDPYLKIDTQGFYNYSSGQDSIYKRVVILEDISSDIVKMTVKVFWKGRFFDREIKLIDYLYNWK